MAAPAGAPFVEEMDETLWRILAARDATLLRRRDPPPDTALVKVLLRGALHNELEASEIAARWVVSTREIDAKIAFAQQAGDEARHYGFIAARLEELGEDLSGFDPVGAGYGRLFEYLLTLETTTERIAAAQFTREAIGYKANELFIQFCRDVGDEGTAAARRAILRTLELAEELRSLAAGRLLVEALPGC